MVFHPVLHRIGCIKTCCRQNPGQAWGHDNLCCRHYRSDHRTVFNSHCPIHNYCFDLRGLRGSWIWNIEFSLHNNRYKKHSSKPQVLCYFNIFHILRRDNGNRTCHTRQLRISKQRLRSCLLYFIPDYSARPSNLHLCFKKELKHF